MSCLGLVFTDENGVRWKVTGWHAMADMYRVNEVVPFWRFWNRLGDSKLVGGEYIAWCLRYCGTIQGPS